MKLFIFQTVLLSIIRSLFTVHSAMVYILQVCRQLLSRTRVFHSFPAQQLDQDVPFWSCSTAVYKTVWHILLPSVQWINSWWWTDELSETRRVSWQNKFVKLVHLVGFITKRLTTFLAFNCPLNWTCICQNILIIARHRGFVETSEQINYVIQQLRWSRGSALPLSAQVRGFKPGRSCQDFQGRKILSMLSFGGEVKPSVPCRRFTACKRSLNVVWKSTFRQNYWMIFSLTKVPPFTAWISRVVWMWRYLAAKVRKSKKTWGLKGSHNKPKGCGASRAYAPGPDDEEQELCNSGT
jgi:hypothetical protein